MGQTRIINSTKAKLGPPKKIADYSNDFKALFHASRAQLVHPQTGQVKTGLVFELAGPQAAGSQMMSKVNPNLRFRLVEGLQENIDALEANPFLRKNPNIQVPHEVEDLETVLHATTQPIGFIDADFRGFPSAMTLGIVSNIPNQCIRKEGTAVWINTYRKRSSDVNFGIQPDDLPLIEVLLKTVKDPQETHLRAAMAQVAIARHYLSPKMVAEFIPTQVYLGRSNNSEPVKDGRSWAPMEGFRMMLFPKRPEHPESKFNLEVEELRPDKKDLPFFPHGGPAQMPKKEDLERKERRIVGGLNLQQLKAFAPLIAVQQWGPKEISQQLGLPQRFAQFIRPQMVIHHPDLPADQRPDQNYAVPETFQVARWLQAGIPEQQIRNHFPRVDAYHWALCRQVAKSPRTFDPSNPAQNNACVRDAKVTVLINTAQCQRELEGRERQNCPPQMVISVVNRHGFDSFEHFESVVRTVQSSRSIE
jgi:hypothetical protein